MARPKGQKEETKKKLFEVIERYCTKYGECLRTDAGLGKDIGKSAATVTKYLIEMKEAKEIFIITTQHRGESRFYSKRSITLYKVETNEPKIKVINNDKPAQISEEHIRNLEEYYSKLNI